MNLKLSQKAREELKLIWQLFGKTVVEVGSLIVVFFSYKYPDFLFYFWVFLGVVFGFFCSIIKILWMEKPKFIYVFLDSFYLVILIGMSFLAIQQQRYYFIPLFVFAAVAMSYLMIKIINEEKIIKER